MKKNKNKELELSKGIKKVLAKACAFSFDFNQKGLLKVTLDVERTHFRIWIWNQDKGLIDDFNLKNNTFIYPKDLNELVLFERAVESLISKLNQK